MIVHLINASFGSPSSWGARSAHIAFSKEAIQPTTVLCSKFVEPSRANVLVKDLPLGRFEKIIRWFIKTIAPARRLPFEWSRFDRKAANYLLRQPKNSVSVLHSWTWCPKTLRALRKQHPQAIAVRDIYIAWSIDRYSRTPFSIEATAWDWFLSPSPFATDFLKKEGASIEKIREVPFGVDTQRFQPAKQVNESISGLGPRPVRFAFLGTINARKGADLLAQTWKMLNLPDAELRFYGTKIKDEIRSQMEGMKNVYYPGFVDPAVELPKDDVFIFPSRQEGSAKVVYEALASGLPVVTTYEAGSVVRDAVDGFVVPSGNIDALGEAMKRLHGDKELRKKFSENARARAEQFTWDLYARRVWQFYQFPSSYEFPPTLPRN